MSLQFAGAVWALGRGYIGGYFVLSPARLRLEFRESGADARGGRYSWDS